MYSKCGSVACAQRVFDRMSERNRVSWNSMITCYEQNGPANEALEVFVKMMDCGIERNKVTLASVVSETSLVSGYAKAGSVKGARYTQNGKNEEALGLFLLLKRESIWPTHYTFGIYSMVVPIFGTAAAQTGSWSLEDGSRLFENMVERDCVSWNAMIVAYAQNGYGTEALQIFQKMLLSGEKPDHITMIGVLCACSHGGLVEEGPGCLDEAKSLIDTMPMQPDAVVWGSLLAACKLGKWRGAMKVRKQMRQQEVIKQPGCSWIKIQSDLHVFMVKDKRHPQRKEMYSLLKMLTEQMKRAGYVPDAGDEQSESEFISCDKEEMLADAAVG
ncbi:hypothetical protein FH972_002911 [Carpinus fangiana]|uniref:Pentatricopeptide repeat-containing protein n=1 Tax=Carpinus fangiana TaxID=176857 RepID=A0A5N6QGB5_9ROSI|nr:hypothetical protein FH972_002911 [Carpinus fangiana]